MDTNVIIPTRQDDTYMLNLNGITKLSGKEYKAKISIGVIGSAYGEIEERLFAKAETTKDEQFWVDTITGSMYRDSDYRCISGALRIISKPKLTRRKIPAMKERYKEAENAYLNRQRAVSTQVEYEEAT